MGEHTPELKRKKAWRLNLSKHLVMMLLPIQIKGRMSETNTLEPPSAAIKRKRMSETNTLKNAKMRKKYGRNGQNTTMLTFPYPEEDVLI